MGNRREEQKSEAALNVLTEERREVVFEGVDEGGVEVLGGGGGGGREWGEGWVDEGEDGGEVGWELTEGVDGGGGVGAQPVEQLFDDLWGVEFAAIHVKVSY